MRFTSQAALALLSLLHLTSALPLDTAPRQNAPRRAKNYSIVNVDGGSATPVVTVIQTVVESEPAPTPTVVASTSCIPTKSSSTSTWGKPFTLPPYSDATPSTTSTKLKSSSSTWGKPFTLSPYSEATPSTTSTKSKSSSTSTWGKPFTLPPYSEANPTASSTSWVLLNTSSTSVTPCESMSSTTAAGPSVVTVTVEASEAATSYYDNGLWHTRYPIRTSLNVVTQAASSASPTSTVEGPRLEHYVGSGVWETLYPPPSSTLSETPTKFVTTGAFPTLNPTAAAYNHTQIPA
ncbi:uncharacterized protein BDZ99DRAFT_460099 [Mytilinidion resinicola]|uniref:Uncharacterized protein n=1 Tax=Mytilinidion resinicola TaxID=574789 RepID=A0A6A6Z155_9PEZI|nr:uncharacterized protein BDZ99DRAFT_460099 [Mytilinidion resinicola]KAF2814449.1 hypothetical protein BDZ99DRAFT_460099 [Mytilinidion resinicola]